MFMRPDSIYVYETWKYIRLWDLTIMFMRPENTYYEAFARFARSCKYLSTINILKKKLSPVHFFWHHIKKVPKYADQNLQKPAELYMYLGAAPGANLLFPNSFAKNGACIKSMEVYWEEESESEVRRQMGGYKYKDTSTVCIAWVSSMR